MKKFIFTERNGIHIIDLQQTVQYLSHACDFVRDTVAGGKNTLFCGTKRQAQESIETEAKRCRMPYVNNRWLGGTSPTSPQSRDGSSTSCALKTPSPAASSSGC
jgi:small subunit ribosomal protein S2